MPIRPEKDFFHHSFPSPPARKTKYGSVMIKDGRINFSIPVEDITYVQAEHVYVRLYLRNRQSMLVRQTMTSLSKKLADKNFLRVHRSYLVNLDALSGFISTHVYVGDQEIPISRNKRGEVLELLNSL